MEMRGLGRAALDGVAGVGGRAKERGGELIVSVI